MKRFLHPSVLVAALLLALLPIVLPNSYIIDIVIRICLAAISAIGLNLLMGFAGQVSIGHAAFVAMGAYASGISTAHFGWPPLVALPAAAVGVALVAYLIAKPFLRLKGHSLTMATLGLGIIVNIVLVNESAWTGGPDGMPVGPLKLGEWTLQGEYQWYALVAVLLVLAMALSLNLFASPGGRALRAVNGSEVAAKVMGVDVSAFKVRVFVASAVFASVAGSLSAHYSGFITPQLASFMHSVELATMVVVGGMASTVGVVLGACLLVMLPQLLGGLQGYEMIFFGLILMMTMIFMPHGLVPSLLRFFEKKEK